MAIAAEHPDVLLPVMVMHDGFITSHAMERVELLSDEEVKQFVGEYRPALPTLLDVKNPVTYGPLDFYDYYFEHKRQQVEGMAHAQDVILEVAREYEKLTGRKYGLFEAYRLEDAEVAIVVLSSTAGTTKAVVDKLRSQGKKVGLWGDCAAFSLNQNKNLSAGEGGFLTTDDDDIFDKAARLWQFGEIYRPDGSRDMNAHGMGWMYRTAGLPAALARAQLAKLDHYTEVFQTNGRYLTRELSQIPGVEPPAEPEGYEHVFYNYPIRFKPEQVGLDMDAEDFRLKVSAALNAEGVEVAPWWNIAIPDMVLFQQKDGYGKGCPWSCPYARRDVSYDNLDLPQTRQWLKEYALIRHLHAPNDLRVMEAFVRAFRKVFDQLDEVLR